jgi:hypothetical protein
MNNSVLVVEGYDARLYVERGHLVTRDGFPNEGKVREIHFPRGRCSIERIVVRAPGGSISMEAIDWCARMGIAISFVSPDSSLLNRLVPDAPHDGTVKKGPGRQRGHRRRRELGQIPPRKEDGLAGTGDREKLSRTRYRQRLRTVCSYCTSPRVQSVTHGDSDACRLSCAGRPRRTSLLGSPGRGRPCRGENGHSNGYRRIGPRSRRERAEEAIGCATPPIRSTRS